MSSPLRITSKLFSMAFLFLIELSDYFSVLTSNHSSNPISYTSAILTYLLHFNDSVLVNTISFP